MRATCECALSPPLLHLLLPTCSVRLPLARRTRLAPICWGPLPSIDSFVSQLKELSKVGGAFSRGGASGQEDAARLEGIRDLLRFRSFEEGALVSSLRSPLNTGGGRDGDDDGGGGGNGSGGGRSRAAASLARAAAARNGSS